MDPARTAPTGQQSTANSQQTTPTSSLQGIAPPPPVVSPSSLAQSAVSQPPVASSQPSPLVAPESPNITKSINQTAVAPIDQQSAINPAKRDLAPLDNQQSLSSGHPEVKTGLVVSPEVEEIEVIPESPEISPELAEHLELVKRHEIELPGPVDVGIHEGQQVTISPAAPSQPKIVLPVTQSDFVQGQSQPVTSAWRWLVEWVKRIILKYPGRAIYRAH